MTGVSFLDYVCACILAKVTIFSYGLFSFLLALTLSLLSLLPHSFLYSHFLSLPSIKICTVPPLSLYRLSLKAPTHQRNCSYRSFTKSPLSLLLPLPVPAPVFLPSLIPVCAPFLNHIQEHFSLFILTPPTYHHDQ